jgi:hypothetical protein
MLAGGPAGHDLEPRGEVRHDRVKRKAHGRERYPRGENNNERFVVKEVRAVLVVDASGIEAEQLWNDPSRWASWIDGFGHLSKLEGEWPLPGARRVWGSRERFVSETVSRYEPGSGLVTHFEDERVAGVQRVTFETDNVRTRVTVELDVEPKERLAPGPRWWLRRRLRESLRRTLVRFTYELAGER